MNKTTIAAVLIVAILGAVVFFVTREAEQEEMAALKIPAIRAEVKKEGEKAKDDDTPEDALEPADRIVITRGGAETELVKRGEEWRITKPFSSHAETYKIRSMLRVFKKGATSNYARKVTEADLPKYGLDEANRIGAALYRGEEKLVDILIGYVDKKEQGIDPDTLVMEPGGEIVYRMKEVDLRTPFEVEFGEIRDKKLFDFKKDEVKRISVSDPRQKVYPKLVLERREPLESAPEAPKTPKKGEWKVVEPKNLGLVLDNIDGFASSIANARATEFLKKLPGADAKALDKAYKLTATVVRKGSDKEEQVTLLLGAGRKKGVYARVEDKDEVILIAKHSATQLMKSMGDLRNKKLFSFKPADVVEIRVENPGSPAIHVKKSGESWAFVEPAGIPAASSKVKSLASNVSNFKVAEFLEVQPKAEITGLTPDKALKVTATLTAAAGSGTSVILVGERFENEKEQERYWAKLEGKPEVFSIMKYTRENVLKTVDDLKDKRLFRFDRTEIVEVVITHPDETLKFARQGLEGPATWKMTAPEEKADVNMSSILGTMTSLDVAKTVVGKKPEDVGLTTDAFTVTVKLKGGATHSVTFSEEVVDNENYAMSATAPAMTGQIFTVSKFKVQNLNKKLPDFNKKAKPGGPPGGPTITPMGMPPGGF